MKTTLHVYRFDTRKPDESTAWAELRAQLKATHPHCMESHGGALHYQPAHAGAVTLETAPLFENQWNAILPDGKGYRVFDWALDYNPHGDPKIKQGHYLVQTEEMREIRRNTAACGYCGAQEPAQKGYVFCPHCIGSEYLKASELHLTRMRPVDTPFSENRAPLSDAERAHLLPLYRDAQLQGNTARDRARVAKARAGIVSKRDNAIRNATMEHDGFAWLMDHGIKTDNVIFYSHAGRFCFGWRANGCDAELVSAILDCISEFPFPYEVKCADGRNLQGY